MKMLRKKHQKNIKKNIEKKTKNVETPENLARMLVQYKRIFVDMTFKVSRLQDLLSRPSAKKLSKDKLDKLQRKYEQSTEELKFSESAIDSIEFRLSQIT